MGKNARTAKPVSTATTARRTASTTRAAKSTSSRRPATTAKPARGTRGSGPARRTQASAPALRWTETLRDGTHVLIRPITRADAALERAFISRLSPQSRRLRFLGQIGEPGDALIRSLVDLDWRRDAAFIALVHHDGAKREVGVSRYSLSPDGRSCECAVTVDDEWHGRGLAVVLMRHLVELARSRGIGTMFSIDAGGNQRMRDLARYLGFACKPDPDEPGQVIHTLALAAK
ncbi:MAG: GNAT family N-acetyltransferase [Lysobacteraceae bacterium]|nr:MAG: GNAT family N-acetyltransferase [Xanthomonadaceae bacterium]